MTDVCNDAGIALIKTEYMVKDHVRSLSLNYVSEKCKLEILDDKTDASGEPVKKKLKGQNKNRRQRRELIKRRDEKLCPQIVKGILCPYQDKCEFVHDVQTYVASKQPDIGTQCHLFETFGYCQYGVTCRFGASHLTEQLNNMKNEELSALHREKTRTRNRLDKEVQFMLRKRQYDFKAADLVIDALRKFSQVRNCRPESEQTSATKSGLDGLSDCTLGSKEPSELPTTRHWCSDFTCFLSHDQVDSEQNPVTDASAFRLKSSDRKKIDFSGKLCLSPLTTVGNLPFRRICKQWGADITCSEMVLANNLLRGQQSEWALLKRHESEDIFGVQMCGAHADQMTYCAQLLSDQTQVDFVDINVGCPLDLVCQTGAGCSLMNRLNKLEDIVGGMRSILCVPLTVKIRSGFSEKKPTAHTLIPKLVQWGVDMIAMHGRSREQRFTKSADWTYIEQCARLAAPTPFLGCGDVLSHEQVNCHLADETAVTGVLIARGALIKPWIFKEIKEQRYIDISSKERFDILRDYVNYGLEHWGSDTEGVEKTRRFLLEWLSFLYRYIPVGILERLPPKINERPPYYRGRDDLETLMASQFCADWIKISEMLLGPVPAGFTFLPKHKANSYS